MPEAFESFETADQALSWLYEVQSFGVKLGLEGTESLLRRAGIDIGRARIIHVAGTNGKGSTCAMAHGILSRHGTGLVGLFTSPHLVRFSERIRDQHRSIEEEELRQGLGRLRVAAESLDPHPTFFELTFALAMDWFARRGTEWIVLETGLGGRLDSTNVVSPAVTVITRIGMDHAEILGSTLEEIAREKAGIIKSGVPVITCPQPEGVIEVLQERAQKKGTAVTVISDPVSWAIPGLPGEHQRWNAALALGALGRLGFPTCDDDASQALAAIHWPGRFQRWGNRWVLDCAHNPAGAEALVRTWREEFPHSSPLIVFAVAAGKAAQEIINQLAGLHPVRWILPKGEGPRLLEPDRLAPKVPGEVRTVASVAEGLRMAADSPAPVLVTGSIFLIGEALSWLEGGDFEASQQ